MTRQGTGTAERLPRVADLGLIAIAALCAIVVFHRTIGFPYTFDDIDLLERAGRYQAGLISLGDLLFRPHNEHVIPLVASLVALCSRWFHLNAVVLRLFLIAAHATGAWVCGRIVARGEARTSAAVLTTVLYAVIAGGAASPIWYPAAAVFLLPSVAVWWSVYFWLHARSAGMALACFACCLLLSASALSSAVALFASPILVAAASAKRTSSVRRTAFAVAGLIAIVTIAFAARQNLRYQQPLPLQSISPTLVASGLWLILLAPGKLILSLLPWLRVSTASVSLAAAVTWIALLLGTMRMTRFQRLLVSACWAGPAALGLTIGITRGNQPFATLLSTDRYLYPFIGPLAIHAGFVVNALLWRTGALWKSLPAAVAVLMTISEMRTVARDPLHVPVKRHENGWLASTRLSQLIREEATPARAGGDRREAGARARSEVGDVKGAPPSEVKMTLPTARVPIPGLHKNGLTLPALIGVTDPEALPTLSFATTVSRADQIRLNRVLNRWSAELGWRTPAVCVQDGVLRPLASSVIDFRINPYDDSIRGVHQWEGSFRWMGPEAQISLPRASGPLALRVSTMARPVAQRFPDFDGFHLTVSAQNTVVGKAVLDSDGEREFHFGMPESLMHQHPGDDRIFVTITARPVWKPADVLPGSTDTRQITVALVAAGLTDKSLAMPVPYTCSVQSP